MSEDPVFILTSSEARPTLIPRKCWIIEKLISKERGDIFLRLYIEPILNGKILGAKMEKGDQEIDEVVIATRYKGDSLDPLSNLPITVYMSYIVNNQIRNTGKVSSKDLYIILIGEIYKTIKDAEVAIKDEKMRI
jgi:hypothetical protein